MISSRGAPRRKLIELNGRGSNTTKSLSRRSAWTTLEPNQITHQLIDELTINKVNSIFDEFPFYKSYIKGLVIKLDSSTLFFLNENLEIDSIPWSSEYKWARERINIDQKGSSPESFDAFLEIGDFIYLKSIDDVLVLDQIPVAEASLVSIDPKDGKLISIGRQDFRRRSNWRNS